MSDRKKEASEINANHAMHEAMEGLKSAMLMLTIIGKADRLDEDILNDYINQVITIAQRKFATITLLIASDAVMEAKKENIDPVAMLADLALDGYKEVRKMRDHHRNLFKHVRDEHKAEIQALELKYTGTNAPWKD